MGEREAVQQNKFMKVTANMVCWKLFSEKIANLSVQVVSECSRREDAIRRDVRGLRDVAIQGGDEGV